MYENTEQALYIRLTVFEHLFIKVLEGRYMIPKKIFGGVCFCICSKLIFFQIVLDMKGQ